MLSFLLAIHFVLTVGIIGLILLQKHDSDGALGSSGGGSASGMFSIRGQTNLLTRSTAILMTIFMINCLVMAKICKTAPKKESIIDTVAKEDAPLAPDAEQLPKNTHHVNKLKPETNNPAKNAKNNAKPVQQNRKVNTNANPKGNAVDTNANKPIPSNKAA